jgi:hypothetical protein
MPEKRAAVPEKRRREQRRQSKGASLPLLLSLLRGGREKELLWHRFSRLCSESSGAREKEPENMYFLASISV